ncbi:MAG: sel1 repeat family protein [Verrucomicrobiales bacterium]|nr:sel1 repeat family protein [Verrucomicrobiales bacterium]
MNTICALVQTVLITIAITQSPGWCHAQSSAQDQKPAANRSKDQPQISSTEHYQLANKAFASGDVSTGRSHLEQAADAGLADAQIDLGCRLVAGVDGTPEIAKAVAWWHKAADVGADPRACHNLALYYHRPDASPDEQLKSDRYLRKAAQAGIPDSECEMGIRAFNRGDYTEARQWNERAARKGHGQGNYNLAMLLEEGKGGPCNPCLAIAHYLMAAAAGYDLALTNLGAIYQDGRGVDRNLIEGAKWYLLGRHVGLAKSAQNLASIRPFMGEGDLAEAQRRANQWWSDHGRAFAGR